MVRKNYKKTYKSKWFVGGKIRVPGGGSIGAGFGSGSPKFSPYSTMRRIAKREIEKKAEPKMWNYTISFNSGVSLKHNTLYTSNVMAWLIQGVGQANRQGDTLKLRYLSSNLYCEVDFSGLPASVAQANLRILVVKHKNESNPVDGSSNPTYGTGLSAADLFLDTGNPYVSAVDKRLATVLYDKTRNIKSQSGTNSGKQLFEHRIKINYNKIFKYKTSNGIYGKMNNIYVVLIPYCQNGVAGTTPIVTYGFDSRLVGFAETD